jgi:hypothetical protein
VPNDLFGEANCQGVSLFGGFWSEDAEHKIVTPEVTHQSFRGEPATPKLKGVADFFSTRGVAVAVSAWIGTRRAAGRRDVISRKSGLKIGDEILSVQGGGRAGRGFDQILNIIAESKGVRQY